MQPLVDNISEGVEKLVQENLYSNRGTKRSRKYLFFPKGAVEGSPSSSSLAILWTHIRTCTDVGRCIKDMLDHICAYYGISGS